MKDTTTTMPAPVAATLRLLVVVLLALGVTGIGAAPASASGGGAFAAVVEGTISATSPTTFDLAGSGGSLRMGPVEYAAKVVITRVDPDTGTITDVLLETFTTRRGDTLTIRCEQVAEEIAPGVYVGADTWTVVGGTGRFEGATGAGTGQTHVDLGAGTFTKVLVGQVTG